jgi:hypothetical protein
MIVENCPELTVIIEVYRFSSYIKILEDVAVQAAIKNYRKIQ